MTAAFGSCEQKTPQISRPDSKSSRPTWETDGCHRGSERAEGEVPYCSGRHCRNAMRWVRFQSGFAESNFRRRADHADGGCTSRFSRQRSATFFSLLRLYERVKVDDLAPHRSGFAPNAPGNAWASLEMINQLGLTERLQQHAQVGASLRSSKSSDPALAPSSGEGQANSNPTKHAQVARSGRRSSHSYFHRHTGSDAASMWNGSKRMAT